MTANNKLHGETEQPTVTNSEDYETEKTTDFENDGTTVPPSIEPGAELSTRHFDPEEVAQIQRLIDSKLRAVADTEEVGDFSLYNIRVEELTESLMKTPEAIAVSRLAYFHRVEQMVRKNNMLQTALLWIAEDLGVELPSTIVNIGKNTLTTQNLRVVHSGSYRHEQLAHITIYSRQRIARLLESSNHANLTENALRNDVSALTQEVASLKEQISDLKKLPLPPRLDPAPVVLCYRDKKNRLNYLGKNNEAFVRTRRLEQAIRFSNAVQAGTILLTLLQNIQHHAFPTAYRLEIHALHLINQPIATLEKDLQTSLIGAKTTAVKYETELKARTAPEKASGKRRKKRRNR